ncbi:hypothetical protein [Marinobacter shengliensis]|uniref:hypothetical protein n=1 Tax=Marinobacter shengliensis TaxID=1389223 RepID=UPI001E5FF72B|nr:hypothetical protein [Marinobacter shengliensis]MCD1628474.1 hypothetical protein [Marinobacter shengliensis]
MVLQDIFDQLTHGELSQVFVGNAEGEGIREEDKLRMISHIQLGLTALHKRFLLKERQLTVELVPNKSVYVLKQAFAQSNDESEEPIKYIHDAEFPFKDDLLKVERVVTDKGTALSINDYFDEDTVRTASYNTLVLPSFDAWEPSLKPTKLVITYRADHHKINKIVGQFISFKEEIDLPVTHLEALLYFVASRVMNPVGIAGEFHEGNNYAQKYEQACMELEQHGHQLNSQSSNSRFDYNGWV